jgi:hypothetical protein
VDDLVAATNPEPEDLPGFDLDDAAVLACIALIIAGLLGLTGVITTMIVGG